MFIYIYIVVEKVHKILVKTSGLSCPHEKEENHVNVLPQKFSCWGTGQTFTWSQSLIFLSVGTF